MYAGLMPIDMKNKSRGLYFVFEPTVGEPVDEVTIWLNGGPGKFCLSFTLVSGVKNCKEEADDRNRLQFFRSLLSRKWTIYLELGNVYSAD